MKISMYNEEADVNVFVEHNYIIVELNRMGSYKIPIKDAPDVAKLSVLFANIYVWEFQIIVRLVGMVYRAHQESLEPA